LPRVSALGFLFKKGDFKMLDSKNQVMDVELRGGAKLYRFDNIAGVAYSGIYDADDREVFSCERGQEKAMIDYWQGMKE